MSSLVDRHLRVPKYLQLAEALRGQIESGALKPGDRLPSFNEMHKQFGATQNTVEKVFALLEKEGLILREPSRGIFVAPTVDTTRQAQTGIVGVAGIGFSFDSYSAYYGELLKGMQKAAAQARVQLLLLDIEAPAGWKKTDGVLFCDWAGEIGSQIAPSQPSVSMLVRLPTRASVVIDEALAQQEATRHLLGLGHRRIAYLHGADVGIISLRESGYYAALAAAGIAPDLRWTRTLLGTYKKTDDFVASGRETMQQWLRGDWRELGCTALMCQNDATAIGVLEALHEAGIAVPDDISLIGFDGTEISQHTMPHLTTIKVPLSDIGQRSMEILLRQIETGQPTTETLVLPAPLLAQGSTSHPPQDG